MHTSPGVLGTSSSFLRITPLCNISIGNRRNQSRDRFVFHTELFYLGPILARYLAIEGEELLKPNRVGCFL
jgi:hypothetical protein